MVTEFKYLSLANCGLRNSASQFLNSLKYYKQSSFHLAKSLVCVTCGPLKPTYSVKLTCNTWLIQSNSFIRVRTNNRSLNKNSSAGFSLILETFPRASFIAVQQMCMNVQSKGMLEILTSNYWEIRMGGGVMCKSQESLLFPKIGFHLLRPFLWDQQEKPTVQLGDFKCDIRVLELQSMAKPLTCFFIFKKAYFIIPQGFKYSNSIKCTQS